MREYKCAIIMWGSEVGLTMVAMDTRNLPPPSVAIGSVGQSDQERLDFSVSWLRLLQESQHRAAGFGHNGHMPENIKASAAKDSLEFTSLQVHFGRIFSCIVTPDCHC